MLPGDLLAGVLSNELFEPRGTFVLHDIVVNLVTFAPIAAIAVVLSFELLLLLGFAPIGITADAATTNLSNVWITLCALIALFVVMNAILFRRDIFKKKAK